MNRAGVGPPDTPDALAGRDKEGQEAGGGNEGGGEREEILWGRKSLLVGMAASIGSLFAKAPPSSPDRTQSTPVRPGRPDAALRWAPSTSYAQGQQVLSPNNDVVSAEIAHTSSVTFASDAKRWNLSHTYAGAADHGVNALKNGCAGNGTTDDTAALHAVRNLASALGVPVFLPRGTYLTTGLTLNKVNQSWVLAKGATILLAGGSRDDVITISAPGVHVQGGKIDGNKAKQDQETSGIFLNAPGAVITHVEATNCYGNGISLLPSATGCLIDSNYCHDNGKSTNAASGIYLRAATLCRVIGNRCEHNGTAGNAVLYDGNGIYLAGGKVIGYNLIANNQCSYNARRGIKVQELGATVTSNVCVLNSTGIGVTNAPNPGDTPTVITGNMIKGSDLQGLQLDNCAFLTITGNVITDSGDHGVGAANGCNQVSFSGNTVARSARSGMNLAGVTDWNITGNMVLDNGRSLQSRYGIVLENGHTSKKPCSHINIVGNTSQNTGSLTTQTHGFLIGGNGDKISLVGNCAENGLTSPYSLGGSVTNLTMFGNRGGGAQFTSINLAPGATIDADDESGFRIGSDQERKIGFWGQTPDRQPAKPPQDATDLASAIALVNDLKAKLRQIGLIG